MTSISSVRSSNLNTNSIASLSDKQLQPVADLFNVSTTDLRKAMKSQTLSTLAQNKKVDEGSLENAIAEGFLNGTPAGGTALTADQASPIAKAIANGSTALGTSFSFGSQKTLIDYINDQQTGQPDDTSNPLSTLSQAYSANSSSTSSPKSIDALAKALGVDPDELTKQIKSGNTDAIKDEITKTYGSAAGIQFDASL